MPTLDQIKDRKKEVSGQVSAQTRTTALGLLAISWALLTAHDEPLKTMAAHANRYSVLGLGVSAAVILALDLLQYVAYTKLADDALKLAEKSQDKCACYDDKSKAFRFGAYLYHGKFLVLAVAAFDLIWIAIELFLAFPR